MGASGLLPLQSTGCSANSLDVQQTMDFQQKLMDAGYVLPLEEIDPVQPIQCQESSDIGAARVQVIPHGFGNPSSEINRASRRFQPYSLSPASALARGAGNMGLNGVNDDAPSAATDGQLPVLLPQADPSQNIQSLPDLEPLTDAEELEMLQELLLVNERRQGMENTNYLSPWHQQLHREPYHFGDPNIPSNCRANDDPSPSTSQLGMINNFVSRLESLPYEAQQQSPQQPIDWDWQQLVRSSAPFNCFLSSEPCALENPPSSSSIILPIVPDIVQVQAAPTVNITPCVVEEQSTFDMMANTELLTSAHSQANRSTNYVEFSAPAVTAAVPRGRGRGNRLPRQRRPATRTGIRHRQLAPKPDGTMGVPPPRINRAEIILNQVLAQRQNHILLESQRRKHMNQLFSTIRGLLPTTATETRSDNATVVLEMVNFINHVKNQQEMLEGQLREVRSAVRNNILPQNHVDASNIVMSTVGLMTKSLTCVDHTLGEASASTAVTTLPAVGSHSSSLASFLGTNVAIHVCGGSCFVSITCPENRSVGLLERIVVTLIGHHLEVLCVAYFAHDNTKLYSIQCQANWNVEPLRNDLHAALQSLVNDCLGACSSQGDQA